MLPYFLARCKSFQEAEDWKLAVGSLMKYFTLAYWRSRGRRADSMLQMRCKVCLVEKRLRQTRLRKAFIEPPSRLSFARFHRTFMASASKPGAMARSFSRERSTATRKNLSPVVLCAVSRAVPLC